jgi:DNA-directed RNA polymerase subunit RPC12/RpoP
MPDVTFFCSNCTQKLACDDSACGSSIECPTCKSQIQVPGAEKRMTDEPFKWVIELSQPSMGGPIKFQKPIESGIVVSHLKRCFERRYSLTVETNEDSPYRVIFRKDETSSSVQGGGGY